MSIARFFVRDVTIVHPALVASYGDAIIPDYDTPTTSQTKGWLRQLSQSEQQLATRDAQISTHVLRVPAGTIINADDRIVIDGQTFEVDGPPAKVWRPQGEHHVRANLRYVDG